MSDNDTYPTSSDTAGWSSGERVLEGKTGRKRRVGTKEDELTPTSSTLECSEVKLRRGKHSMYSTN